MDSSRSLHADTSPATRDAQLRAPAPVLDLVIPVYNEERGLERAVRATQAHRISGMALTA
ncbi:hypothetical protein [Promicromonospora panici]|uniref:hypothetical protein n=1 Tax=Promicromonospora panici TaxID=2219658 RepID=UPI00101C175D|nr:hypothetical protein [Promicromonospora panici]